MKHFSTFLVLFLFSIQLIANNNIWVVDVREGWWSEQGVISDYYLKVQPAGTYATCELTLEFDAESLSFNPSDSLEMQMDFELPQGAVVTDLWLWIFGQAEQADIHDRWTASLIYESIVQRRIDPAILTKNWGNTYNLKVFPIMSDMPRKVKIEYIVPVNSYGAQGYSIPMPMNIAQMSAQWPGTTNVYFDGGGKYSSPSIAEMPDQNFKELKHPDEGLLYGTELSDSASVYTSLTLNYIAENKSIISVGYDKELDENFFELNLKPSDYFDLKEGKKTVFLIDFIEQNSVCSGAELLSNLRTTILQNFDEQDSINLMFSGILTSKASSNWLACSDTAINSIFDNISPEFFNSYSNLTPLLSEGINFIKDNGGTGNIVLVASGHENGSSAEANGLITDLLGLIGKNKIPIHIINLDDYYTHYINYFIGGVNYWGNEYLYKHLSQFTGAECLSGFENDLQTLLTETCTKSGGYFKNISVEIAFNDGYAYSVFEPSTANAITYYDDNWRMVGKYIGSLPITLKVHAQKSTGEVMSKTLRLQADDVNECSEGIKQVWASHLINELKASNESNMVMSTIIETSIEYRVLCNYSAFLVLEPGFVPDIDLLEQPGIDGDIWEGVAVSVDEVIDNKQSLLSNYPNPVKNFTTFRYTVNTRGKVKLSLLNSSGQLVEVLVDEDMVEGEYELPYNAESLKGGIYFCDLQIDGKSVQQYKMIVVR